MMISAAPVIRRAVEPTPKEIAPAVSPVCAVALLDPAEQEHLVVHREAEEDGEEEERHPRLDRVDLLEAEEVVADALLEDEHEQAVGGADREQVERDRDGGDHDRAEGDREQDEAEPEHEGEHDREPAADDVEVVDALRGRSADEHGRLELAERLRDQVGAQVADRRGRLGPVRVAGDRNRDQDGVAAVRDGSAWPGRTHPGRQGSRVSSAIAVRTGAEDDVALDDDLGGIDAGAGEVAVQRVEALLGREAVGQRAQPREARVDREHGQSEREQERRRRDEAEERPPHHAADEPGPERTLGAGALDRPAADHRDPQRVHAVAEQAQHRGQQRQRGDHRDDPDEDRAQRQAAQDRVGHQQHPAHREHEGHPAEEHGAARGRAGRHDRVDLLETAAALFPEAGEDEERVVDPEREPHRRDHVHDEERDLERLPHQGGQGDRDHDREQPQQHRHEARDDRPEDEQEDDQRRRQPDEELALLQILLRELLEVGVGGQRAGDRDLEAVLAVLRLHELDERERRRRRASRAAPSSRGRSFETSDSSSEA